MVRLRVVALVSMALGARTAAADEFRPFRLTYDAPAGCPGADYVVGRIRGSAPRARPPIPDEPAYDVSFRVEGEGTGFTVRLRVRTPDGSETVRSVPAPSCAEAVDAAALIVAITIDPEALRKGAPADGGETRDNLDNPPVASDAGGMKATTVPPAPSEGQSMEDRFVTAPGMRHPRRESVERLSIDAGVGLVGLAISPSVSPDFHASFGYERAPGPLFSPRVALAFHVAESFPVETSGGRAQFERLGGRFTACPVGFGGGLSTVRPCALMELGNLKATGSDVPDSREVNIRWAAAGASVEAELRTSGRWMTRFALGALFPLLRDGFFFAPTTVNFYEIPPVGFFAEVGIGLSIL